MKYEIRQLRKSIGHTTINIVGLALGCTSAMVLFLMILHSTSFDTFHKNRDEIYRIVSTSMMNGREDYTPGVAVPFIEAIRTEHPEIVVAPANYLVGGRVIVDGVERKVYEENEGIVFLDPNFYTLFDREWIMGRPDQSLVEPNQVVLSRKLAMKYFDKLDVVDQFIEVEQVGHLKVMGVVEDFEESKTDFPFDLIISYKTFESISDDVDDWGSVNSDFQCYLLLSPEQRTLVTQNLGAFADKYNGEDRTDSKQYHLQPLADLHHNNNYSNYSYRTVTKGNIWGMAIMAFFLLITACVNFINLSTAQASQRFKATGIRKILGSSRRQLVFSFFLETGLVVFVALLLSVGLTELALFQVNPFLDLSLALNYDDLRIWAFMTSLWVLVTFLSAFYPSMIISNHKPHQAAKGMSGMGKGVGFFLRKTLVVFQFTISQVLIIGTIITQTQLNFFQESEVGFRKEGIVNIEILDRTQDKKQVLKNAILQLPEVENASLSYRAPASTSTSVTNAFYQSEGQREELNVQILAVDKDFISVYELKMLSGSGLHDRDTLSNLVVNEAFVKEIGLSPEEAVGTMIHLWGNDRPINGVVEDFSTFSLAREVMPVALFTYASSYELVSVKFSTGNLTGVMDKLKSMYDDVYPGYGFNYQFIDEQLNSFYEGEQKLSQLLMVFSGIAIFIGCLGLLGLVSFMANRKKKEIGIRKVLGASVFSVIYSFSKEFGVLVLVAFMVATPLAYFGMQSWLQSYANKIELTPIMFVAGVAFSLVAALLTISYKSIAASMVNPADILRDE